VSVVIPDWPAPTVDPTQAEIDTVVANTNGGFGLDDNQVKEIIKRWWYVDDSVAPAVSHWDLWAASAMILEAQEIGLLSKTEAGAEAVNTGDTSISWGRGGNTKFLRRFIRRYWRRANPENQAVGRPSGWTTLDVDTAGRYTLAGWPWSQPGDYLIVNQGPPFD
jgi:hypothetical protein